MKLGLATPFWPPFCKFAIKRSGWEGQAEGSRPRWHGRQTAARQRGVTLPYLTLPRGDAILETRETRTKRARHQETEGSKKMTLLSKCRKGLVIAESGFGEN